MSPSRLLPSRRAFVSSAGLLLFLPALAGVAEPVQETPASDEKALRFFALGDTGAATETRERAIASMATRAERDEPAFVLLLGDNFYETGVRNADDPRFQQDFEDAFAASSLQIPFYAALGNHDHFGNVEAQIEYTKKSERWNMPKRYYSFERELDETTQVAFFVLDTMSLLEGEAGDLDQLAWLEEGLGRSDARWKIVAGHHPLRTGGMHRSDPIPSALEPLFESGEVDLYLSGHDHDLQLLEGSEGWVQVVSGATSRPRKTGETDTTKFATSEPGFVAVAISADAVVIEFVVAPGETRYEHRIAHRERETAGTR